MLRKTQKINCSVQQTRLELRLEIDLAPAVCVVRVRFTPDYSDSPFVFVGEGGDVKQRRDMDRELNEDRKEHIKIEDIPQRPLPRKLIHRLQTTKSASILSVKLQKEEEGGIEGEERVHTFALEMHKKQTLINIPVIVI